MSRNFTSESRRMVAFVLHELSWLREHKGIGGIFFVKRTPYFSVYQKARQEV